MIVSKFNKINPFFSKKWSGVFFNPFYFIRRELYLGIERYSRNFSGNVIDIGCGTKPYEHLFANTESYIGVDIETSGNTDNKTGIDIFYDGQVLPFESESLDGVFSSETFEHIFNLEEILSEINRVLRKDGLVIFTCPFFIPEHEIPFDFARYSSFGIQHLMEKHNFTILQQEKTGNYFTSMLQMQALFLYYFIRRIPLLHPLLFILFISPIFILGSAINVILPSFLKRKDLYLNNIVFAKKN